ncbi:hypothetical protein BDA96_05G069500 [Sorghum bicolor]|uniref:BRCT domain-containing protein n=1 Tax=Sorghum bicolor TaxID=4558 RepID=A0A921QXS2_SORBI|nr:hypothetical protein BDA96_05G069500 [Sorghum bicolor]
MDGVKTLCSGFEKSEKVRIEELVTAMGGHLLTRHSMDVDFVIVKDVTVAKYKWALNILKKPIVTMKWLEQCWIEHRVVPHEPYRILPFTGLNICLTKLDPGERKELEKMVVQNGGQFSPCLTRKCTHLVANKPGGDKYVVAQKWGNIHIVNPRWVEQSVARRACQDESSYLVCQSSSAFSGSKSSFKEQQNPEISSASASFQPVPATSVDDSVSMSQYLPASFGDAARISIATPSVQETNEMQVDSRVAEDSEPENDDLYLSNCRIALVGFEEKELLRLVMMIRNGGGSRHILLSEKLTHIVIGTPSDDEKKEVRCLAAWGVINIVKVTWLEDCNRAKKEVKVSPMHIATELLLKGFSQVSMENSADTRETKVGKSSGGIFHVPTVNDLHDKHHEKDVSSERKPKRGKHENSISKTRSAARAAKLSQQNGVVNVSEHQPQYQVTSTMNSGSSRSNIFKGRTFSFSNSFSHDKRPEVVDWVRDGGGVMVDDIQSTAVDFIIECHGQNSLPCDFSHSTVVSTQWIRSCLEENCLQDVGSHPIFSPLRCRIPFPGFESFQFCISQYEEKERQLLKNLCFLLGAKFTEKAYKRVTHLICKFASGPKYEVYTKRGTPTITSEWLYECVKQDKLLPVEHFQPKPITSQDQDANACTISQYSTQATRFGSSEVLSDCQVTTNNATRNSAGAGIFAVNEETTMPAVSRKRRISVPVKVNDTCGNIGRSEKHLENSSGPDVADAIEVLSSKIQDVQSPRSIFEPDNSVVQEQKDTHSFGISRSWLNMQPTQDNTPGTKVKNLNSAPVPSPAPITYYPFSETQTESQIVGYEEDLTGMQKIIDRVRSQSINVTPSSEIP